MKTLKNKRSWLGILVIALVFGMTVVGCDGDNSEDDYDPTLFPSSRIPAELIGKWVGNGNFSDRSYTFDPDFFGAATLIYQYSSSGIAYVYLDQLRITPATNLKVDTRVEYPSGYEITGRVFDSTEWWSFIANITTYTIFLNASKDKFIDGWTSYGEPAIFAKQ